MCVFFVAGCTYELEKAKLEVHPTLVFNNEQLMRKYFDPRRSVYILSRNRAFFEVLVFYINHGILTRPLDIPLELYVDEMNYYFEDKQFLKRMLTLHDIPETIETVEVRYLPTVQSKCLIWRAMEYNETVYGTLYHFIFGSICLTSIWLFLNEIMHNRSSDYVSYMLRYRGGMNATMEMFVNVSYIDYRPITKWSNKKDGISLFFYLEIMFAILWTVELTLRWIAAPTYRLVINTPLFWIDVLTISNSYLFLLLGGIMYRNSSLKAANVQKVMYIFQTIDILKTLRIIKLGRYHSYMKQLVDSLSGTMVDFSTLIIVVVGTSSVFGTLLYVIERSINPSSIILFPEVGQSIYYTLLAISNVGFEQFLPSTYIGKWIACLAITIGLFTMVLPFPMILSPYTKLLVSKKKRIVYQDIRGNELQKED
ncbi:unnamed protein product [Didymodactylos carnosus]|uniref:Uncharacterized protein n=1 Tax=Didymodactylos carnosus TaxID=1234261 RepID=A0A813UNL8_9BILA|nr:unnamed protein product [Didymodactylos carnosus]CAF0825878.1 unnamed protein product [Didymodactylos carnosus]CAF3518436.1 unnamed protein product [Didymodactylos carnosus]CAF3612673.1 unnamed protein product [Didymodactylos carnosus]